jgi:hypothetical protein
MRGSSIGAGALDVQILTDRIAAELTAKLEVITQRDEGGGDVFEARLARIVIGTDKRGRESSTLVIEDVVEVGEGQPAAGFPKGKKDEKGHRSRDVEKLKRAIIDAYGRLADAVEKTGGFDGKPVKKVDIDKIREEVRDRGFLETNDAGFLTSTGRSKFLRAKVDLIDANRFIEHKRKFWRVNEW